MNPDTESNDLLRVQAACRTLIEYFDSVQIFCTRHESYESDGTVSLSYGEGDWFSRYGKIQEWMVRQDERTREDVRKDAREGR